MIKLDINNDAAVKFTNKLEKLHRSALPNAIRGTLNKAAFDVKQRTMPASAGKEFVNRSKNFFRATSRVDMATGYSVKLMQAKVGFTEQGLSGENNFAVKDLEQQERGGIIKGRSFIPTDVARGGNNTKLVRPGNRLSSIRNIQNSNKRAGNKRQNFIKAVLKAGVGGFVIGNNQKKILWRIDAIDTTRGKLRVRKKAIYSFKEDRGVRVSGTGFMRNASLETGKRLNEFYVTEAERQVQKLMK